MDQQSKDQRMISPYKINTSANKLVIKNKCKTLTQGKFGLAGSI